MAIDPFEELLQKLGEELGIPLHPDKNHSCAIRVDSKLTLQIEISETGASLLLGAHIAEIDPGKFRENVLATALKANNLPYPQVGTFGYSAHHNQLALFEFLSLEDLNGKKLSEYLMIFTEKAMEWQDAIIKGNLSQIHMETEATSNKPFGLK